MIAIATYIYYYLVKHYNGHFFVPIPKTVSMQLTAYIAPGTESFN